MVRVHSVGVDETSCAPKHERQVRKLTELDVHYCTLNTNKSKKQGSA